MSSSVKNSIQLTLLIGNKYIILTDLVTSWAMFLADQYCLVFRPPLVVLGPNTNTKRDKLFVCEHD